MNRIIDGHAHIIPAHLLGKTDEALGTKMVPFGRLIYENGETTQRMPPFFETSSFSTEALLRTMREHGAEKAVLLQSYTFRINEDIAEAVTAYPDILRGAMVIDPREQDAAEQVYRWNRRGLSIIKFEMSTVQGFSHPKAYPGLRFDAPDVMALFDTCQELGMTAVIDTSPVRGSGYQVEAIGNAVKIHPRLKFVICHLGFSKPELVGDRALYNRWLELCELARFDNVWFDVSALPDLFLETENYPFPTALMFVKEFLSRYGELKLIWGSDVPGSLGSATYRQMIDMFALTDLSESCKEALFRTNAETVYFN